jgi:hypothetical protein
MFNHLVADLKSSSISPKSSIHNKHSEHSKPNEIPYCFVLLGRNGKLMMVQHAKVFPLGSPLSRVKSRYETNALKKSQGNKPPQLTQFPKKIKK